MSNPPPRFVMPPTTPPSRPPLTLERIEELRRGMLQAAAEIPSPAAAAPAEIPSPAVVVPGEIPPLFVLPRRFLRGARDPLAQLLPTLTPADIDEIRRSVDPDVLDTIIEALQAARRAVPPRSSVVSARPPRRGGKSTRRLKSKRNKHTRRHVR